MAFQPVVDLERRAVVSYEALVRGRNGEGAAHVLSLVHTDHRYAFDQACRIKAVAIGTRLGVGTATRLGINCLPNSLCRPDACLRATLRVARHYRLPADRLVCELTEGERVTDVPGVAATIRECQRLGLRVALDDFGAGYAGLNLLADLHPDVIKLDGGLCRGVDGSRTRRAIVHGVVAFCRDLEIEIVAEGIETPGEAAALRDLGVRYFQGYLFARPAVETLPAVHWPAA